MDSFHPRNPGGGSLGWGCFRRGLFGRRAICGYCDGAIARDKANGINPGIGGGGKVSDGGNAPVRLTEATSSLTAAESAPLRLSPATVPATGVTLSANDASISELAAAFESAGISNAQRWAREADEYRPYSVDDTGYTKLRGELAKYNPASGVVDAIVARLHLP